MRTIDFATKVQDMAAARRLSALWKSSANYGLVSAEKNMYGEATAGSLDKLWQAIVRYVQTAPDDLVCDWGAGAGKMLISRRFFAPYPGVRALGIERDASVYETLRRNREIFHDPMVIIKRDSTTIEDWEGVTIVLQYDGPSQTHTETYHYDIITRILCTNSLKCLFSTKLNKPAFLRYAAAHGAIEPSDWVHIKVKNLSFGGCGYTGHLYIRRAAFNE